MAIRDDFTAGEVLAAADLNDTFGAKINYPSGGADGNALIKSGTSAAWGSAGGLVHIATESFSAVSSVSLNGVFTSTYENYLLVVRASASAAGDIDARLRLSGTDASTNYNRQFGSFNATTVAAARETSQTFARFIAGHSGTATAVVQVFSPAEAKSTVFQSHTGGNPSTPLQALAWGSHTTATAYDGITFFPASGTITGTIRVYGYANS
jgi:hypothetical protein